MKRRTELFNLSPKEVDGHLYAISLGLQEDSKTQRRDKISAFIEPDFSQ